MQNFVSVRIYLVPFVEAFTVSKLHVIFFSMQKEQLLLFLSLFHFSFVENVLLSYFCFNFKYWKHIFQNAFRRLLNTFLAISDENLGIFPNLSSFYRTYLILHRMFFCMRQLDVVSHMYYHVPLQQLTQKQNWNRYHLIFVTVTQRCRSENDYCSMIYFYLNETYQRC